MSRARKRPGMRAHQDPNRRLVITVVAVAVVFVAVAVAIGISMGSRPAGGGAGSDEPVPWPGTEIYPSEGADHVPVGTRVNYRTDPPTSGSHYDAPAVPRFYDQSPPAEALVHNLEHGHVIIHYDRERLAPEDVEAIRRWTERYTGDWDAVVAVPRQDQKHPVILTAWRHALRLESYNEEAVAAFIDAYRGRGPENPMR